MKSSWVDYGLACLARREYSAVELTRKLRQKGASRAEADAAVSELQQGGYQSDVRFAVSLWRHKACQGYGPHWIRAVLKLEHQIPAEVMASACDHADLEWDRLTQQALEKAAAKYPGLPAKARAYLMRRGFERVE